MLTVVCQSADHAHDKAATTDSLGTTSRSVICVLPEDTRVFFMNADNVLDDNGVTIMRNIGSRLQWKD
jgi:hypothetical protein